MFKPRPLAQAFFKKIIYLFIFVCVGSSLLLPLVATSRDYSPVVVCGLLIAVASLVAEHGE